MGDPDTASGAALAVALARGEAPGLLAAHDTYGPDLVGYAEFLLTARPAPADAGHPADEAAAAVLDALLVATGTAGDLTDPDRMRAWLLALTRNECLRRRPGAGAPAAAEAAELGRRGLRPAEVAVLLGYAPDQLPGRRPAPETPAAWLRDELAAAAGPAGAARRAQLTRRARPFDPDGFPVPLDRRRLPVPVLAWSAAAAVVLALGLLVLLPTGGGAAAAVQQGPLLAAAAESASPTAAAAPEDPLPTLADEPFGSRSPRPEPAADRGAPRAEVTAAPTPPAPTPPAVTPPARTAARPDARTEAEPGGEAAAIAVTWTRAGCGDGWTAALHATTGGADVGRVVAVGGGSTTVLHRDGDGWSGELAGLPTDRAVTVTVWADGPVRPATTTLRASC